jgi:signal transduction histidine kinase
MLHRLARAAVEVLPAQAAAILLPAETGEGWDVAAWHGAFPEEVQPHAPPLSVPVTEPFLVTAADARRDVLLPGFTSAMGVPLDDGALLVYSTQTAYFDADALARLGALVDLGQAALQATRALAGQEQVEAGKAYFIRVATHELRSPVAVAQSLVRTVLKGYAGPLAEQQADIFARVANRLDFLEHLINDLLDLAASKAPGLERAEEPVALNACVGRAVLLLMPRAEEKDVNLVHQPCCEQLVVWATEEGLDRIFTNLVSNAVKYTPPGGRVTVSMGHAEGEVRACVADSGIGIPAEALPQLFEEFYRAPNARDFAVGTGLGLAIVKDLVERYAGRVEVESRVGEGTTFTVFFPVHRL